METIAVIFGGKSAEHDVSIITALSSIIKPLELTKKYHVEPVYIAKDGSWHWDKKLKDIKLFTSGGIKDFLHKNQPASVQFDGGMKLVKASGLAGRKTVRNIDLVFPAMHGTYGEDGSLMGLLEMAGVPYVGCNLSASVLAMDKVLSKLMAEAHGIATPAMQFIASQDLAKSATTFIKNAEAKLKYPVFVKPAHLGSSIGITRVNSKKELSNALEVAAHYDDKILVEEEVPNLIEVTLPIMGNEDPVSALLERPLTTAEDFFDFETKYMQGGKKGKGGTEGAQGYSELPAKLDKKTEAEAIRVGRAVYKALGCTGTARIDMLIDSQTSKVYFNEVNPLPGSLYAHNWRAAGVSTVSLVDKLVQFAKERHAQQSALNTTFQTNYLQQF